MSGASDASDASGALCDTLRWLALIALVASAFVPVEGVRALRTDVQWALAGLAVLLFIMVDAIAAFVVILALMVLYFRITITALSRPSVAFLGRAGWKQEHIPVISERVLGEIQSNTVSANEDLIGIPGIYGKGVYGAQGHMPGSPSGYVPEEGASTMAA